jgi:hypothetical protein
MALSSFGMFLHQQPFLNSFDPRNPSQLLNNRLSSTPAASAHR